MEFKTIELPCGRVYVDLPPGTVLIRASHRPEGRGLRIKVINMKSDFAYVEHVRKDGLRDQRYGGWSGCLKTDWTIVASTGEASAK